MRIGITLFFSFALLAACGDDGRVPVDTGTAFDTSPGGDTGTTDTGTMDSATTDTGAGDTSTTDTAALDTAVADTAIPDAGPVTGQYVLDFLDIARPAAGGTTVAGMNIDGLVSTASDTAGCRHADFTSPPPDSETGVDNQLGPLVESLGASFTVDFAPFIASGELIILAQVTGSGSLVNIELFQGDVPGGGAPALTGGTLSAGQTFDVTASIGVFTGSEVGGRLKLGPVDTTLPLIPGAAPIPVFGAQIYGTADATGISAGVVGAGARTTDASATLMMLDPTLPITLINAVLDAEADLAPDSVGRCQQISAGLIYTAVPATFTP